MAQRDILIGLKGTEEEAAQFEGRKVMVVPLDDEEIAILGSNLNGVSDFLQFAIHELEQLALAKGGDDAEIAEALQRVLEPMRVALGLQNTARELIGRAMFVGPRRVTRSLTRSEGEESRRKADEAAREGMFRHLNIKPKGGH